MINVLKLCEDSHRISKDKGWLETERSFAGVVALIHSELSEAIEDYRNNRPISQIWYDVKCNTGPVIKLSAEELKRAKAGDTAIVSAKPCGVPSELADVIIRIAQHCGTEGRGSALDSHVRVLHGSVVADPRMTFEEMIAYAHLDVSLAFRSFTKQESFSEVYDHLAATWVLLEGFCKNNDINLEAAVIEKQAFNETRPHRHGGKKI